MNWAVVLGAIGFWLAAWWFNTWLARLSPKDVNARRALRLAVPAIFGVSLLVLWEGITRGANVPTVLLPPPSMIAERFASLASRANIPFWPRNRTASAAYRLGASGEASISAVALRATLLQALRMSIFDLARIPLVNSADEVTLTIALFASAFATALVAPILFAVVRWIDPVSERAPT